MPNDLRTPGAKRIVLVTGGAGFIGSALVRGLLDQTGAARVTVLDNLLTGKAENLYDVQARLECCPADIRD